jgi:heme-degrading monooxygenase HmoA
MPPEPMADTPEPPYVAVIFTSVRTAGDDGYAVMSASMEALAAEQPGYLGIESARDEAFGITVSYWTDHDAARRWKQVAAHLVAQRRGRDVWYSDYRVRVATVERAYSLASSQLGGDQDPDGLDVPGG